MPGSLNISISLKSYIKSIGLKATISYIIQRYILKTTFIILKIPQLKHKIKLRRTTTDVFVFRQIFIQGQFNFLKSSHLNVIIDCGANVGLTTVYMKYLFPKAQIFSIEPEENNFKLLRSNTASYEQIVLINKALSDDCNGLFLTADSNRADSFQTKKKQSGQEKNLKVESITIKKIIQQNGIKILDFVKMDIEGAESYCVTHEAFDWINLTKILAIEIHDSIIPGTSSKIKKLLHDKFDFTQHGEYSVFTKDN